MRPLLVALTIREIGKDLLVCLYFFAIVYLLYILLPAVFKGIRLDGDGDVAYQWLNLPLLFVLLSFYLVYIFYSFKYRKKKMILKYLTYCYMYLLLLFMELGFVLIVIFC